MPVVIFCCLVGDSINMYEPDIKIIDDLKNWEIDAKSISHRRFDSSDGLDLADLLRRARLEIEKLRDPNE
jgi:hypothetical protein